jgi:hypothetical protein
MKVLALSVVAVFSVSLALDTHTQTDPLNTAKDAICVAVCVLLCDQLFRDCQVH